MVQKTFVINRPAVNYKFTCPVCKTSQVSGTFNKADKDDDGYIDLQCSCKCGEGDITGGARIDISGLNVDMWFDDPCNDTVGLNAW